MTFFQSFLLNLFTMAVCMNFFDNDKSAPTGRADYILTWIFQILGPIFGAIILKILHAQFPKLFSRHQPRPRKKCRRIGFK